MLSAKEAYDRSVKKQFKRIKWLIKYAVSEGSTNIFIRDIYQSVQKILINNGYEIDETPLGYYISWKEKEDE